MNIPGKITAGDSVEWLDDSALDGMGRTIAPGVWTLNYAIRGASNLDLVSTVSGAQWDTQITAAQSAALAAGIYYWQAFATNGTSRVTLGTGTIEVLINIATQVAGYDGRNQDEKDLAAVRAEITARVNGGTVTEYAIAGRSLKKEPMAALIAMESRILTKIARDRQAEQIAQGLGNPRQIFVSF